MSLKNGRPRPVQRSEMGKLHHRQSQAIRARDAGRNVKSNKARIERIVARLAELAETPKSEVPA